MTKLLMKHLNLSMMILVRDLVTIAKEQPQRFSVHGQVVNNLGFAGHVISASLF